MKLLFLDFDGVLNNQDTLENSVQSDAPATEAELASVEKLKACRQWNEKTDQFWVVTLRMISPELVARLNTVIKTTGAKVIISSAWRNVFTLEALRIILEHNGFQGEIIDKTPSKMSLHSRHGEIRMWFRDVKDGDGLMAFKDIENFVIIDDDTGPGYEDNWPENFVNTDLDVGLDDAGMYSAIEILNRGQ